MSIIVDILILAGVLLAIVAVVQVAAARLVLPESTLLSVIGIAIGAGYVAIDAWVSGWRCGCIAGSASTARWRARWPTALNC
ncbi:exported hypothetical protein [Cupriavidus taiwanensis]|uniref:hypothetical protein n=1 Tax=Cupriavidus taiwanensis TaxID=164546 RepID=UPI000E17C335|nr:hypothetical protein [Cupriavidus taiwanensis]SOZ17919.1 exported hypothetical protein [Cupriavidus taiwanensis]SOZ30504.1 exported hypothetical protein [Cupriavidus taiwanensis]SOZ49775.1 exported hypothetical protein [Cupriavidus taiwanensis]